MTTTYYTIDLRQVRPGDLVSMDNEQFGNVVDADLRNARDHELAPDVAQALRSEENVDRWYQALARISKSVDGQLAVQAEVQESKQAAIRHDLILLKARIPEEPHNIAQLPREIANKAAEGEALKAEYLDKRSRRLRFKSAVDEAMLEARGIREAQRGGVYESVVEEERNRYAARVQVLNNAILAHHQQAQDADLEPEDHDLTLWNVAETP